MQLHKKKILLVDLLFKAAYAANTHCCFFSVSPVIVKKGGQIRILSNIVNEELNDISARRNFDSAL